MKVKVIDEEHEKDLENSINTFTKKIILISLISNYQVHVVSIVKNKYIALLL